MITKANSDHTVQYSFCCKIPTTQCGGMFDEIRWDYDTPILENRNDVRDKEQKRQVLDELSQYHHLRQAWGLGPS